jgi:predicted ATPase
VLLVLDDAPSTPDALGLARLVLDGDTEAKTPLLVVLTASTDRLPGSEAMRRLYAALRAHPRLERLLIAPLNTAQMTDLVGHLIGMRGRLVEGVVRHSAGNPLYAIELVRDWVQQGKLVLGKNGFELRAGDSGEMPSSLQQTWTTQVERQLARLGPMEVRALELAAALGHEVATEEWHAVCALTGMDASDSLLANILQTGMARLSPDGHGWSFGNPMYRGVLETRSRKAGRYPRLHLACARMLEGRATESGHAERSARHLLKAGKPHPALPKLLGAAQERLVRGQVVEAERIMDARDETLRRMRVPTEDPLWGRGWVQKAKLFRLTDRQAEAVELAQRALRSAERHRWTEIQTLAQAELDALEAARTRIEPL